MIDTPGFDDDNRTDVEILEDIARWLNEQGYLKGSDQLDGLIFLHPVTVHRLGGQERRRTRLLQNLLGPNAFKRIIIATTMWEKIRDDDLDDVKATVRAREKDIWYDLARGGHGAKLMRHYKNTESAHHIIKEIIRLSGKYGKIEPLIQEELRRDPKLIRTTTGKSMRKDLESDIRRAKALLAKHRLAKPERPSKTDKSPENTTLKKEYDEWLEEDEELEKRLGRLEANMVKLHRMKVMLLPPTYIRTIQDHLIDFLSLNSLAVGAGSSVSFVLLDDAMKFSQIRTGKYGMDRTLPWLRLLSK